MKEERCVVNPDCSGFFNIMFTGIITHIGRIQDISATKLTVDTGKDFASKLTIGSSVAIDGVCLTVISYHNSSFEVSLMPETKARTNIKYLKSLDLVNLELPATQDTFFSGHIVQGHIDGVARLVGVVKKGNSRILKFSMPNTLSKYIVEKGSIAVDGVSLTVIEAGENYVREAKESSAYFTVGIVPYTWDKTMLHTLKRGDFVNIEVDILAKYLERLVKK